MMTATDVLLFAATALASLLLTKHPSIQQRAEEALRKALQDGTSRDAAERICTVDKYNSPTPEGHTRAEMRLNNLWHRATYILVRHEDNGADEPEQQDYVLVQKRSLLKDYCPGKLDPTPGGVVGFGESYRDNAVRELKEEMGIDILKGTRDTMTRLFTFPYQDSRVRVWGEFFEVIYRGSMQDLKIQKEEVDEVIRMSHDQVRELAERDYDAWMPDALHAIRLYLQYREDRGLNRRMLNGYSSGNLNEYNLRPKPKVIFFDCDDCLYFDGWKVANQLTSKIDEWCVNHGLPPGEAYKLYKKHGTALRGLLAEGHLEHCNIAIDNYLQDVHDIPVGEMLEADRELREIIARIDPSVPKYIFTASVKHHAERCLKALGIDDLFVDIIDVKACNFHTKHSIEAFSAAMEIAGVDDPETCLFLDDNIKNIHAARQVGWRSILVGRIGRDCGTVITSEHAEVEIDRIHDMPAVLPELFEC